MLEQASVHLKPMLDEVVFVGGATVELWITDEAAPEFRPTDDIDIIVEVATRTKFYALDARLKEIGFRNDSESKVICRFRHRETGLILDAMPTEASILGFSNHWQKEAFFHSAGFPLPSGTLIPTITPPYLLASKLEAFDSRGERDFYASRDFGDVVSLIDGREELIDEIATEASPLRSYIADQFLILQSDVDFENGLEGGLPLGPDQQSRFEDVLLPRVESIIRLGIN